MRRLGVTMLAACGRIGFESAPEQVVPDGAVALFADDFETGDTSRWSSSLVEQGNTLAVTSSAKLEGAFGLGVTTDGAGNDDANVVTQLPAFDEMWLRFDLGLASDVTAGFPQYVAGVLGQADGSLDADFAVAVGSLGLTNELYRESGGQEQALGVALVTDRRFCIELHAVHSTGTHEVFVDGAMISTATGITPRDGPWIWVQLGANGPKDVASSYLFDNFFASATRLPCP